MHNLMDHRLRLLYHLEAFSLKRGPTKTKSACGYGHFSRANNGLGLFESL